MTRCLMMVVMLLVVVVVMLRFTAAVVMMLLNNIKPVRTSSSTINCWLYGYQTPCLPFPNGFNYKFLVVADPKNSHVNSHLKIVVLYQCLLLNLT